VTDVSRSKLEAAGDGRFAISGILDAVTVIDLLKDSDRIFTGAKQVDVDLAGVTDSDSSGLALLLEWLRLARLRDQSIHFHHLPPQISALARISEVEDLFDISDETVVPPLGTASA
jgi:phospholipid transport system transporter-binding protein